MADTPRIENRKARQYYEFLEFFEAGIVLTGPEVKSVRAGQVSFGDSFVECREGEAFVVGMRIAPYERGGYVVERPNDERVALFAHHGFGVAFLSCLLDVPYPEFSIRFDIGHSSMTVVNFEGREGLIFPKVLQVSNDSHLWREGLPTKYQNKIYF